MSALFHQKFTNFWRVFCALMAENLEEKVAKMSLKEKGQKQKGVKGKQEKKKADESAHPTEVSCVIRTSAFC